MCVAEEGSAESPSYIAAHVAATNGGVALFGVRYRDKAASSDNGLLDPSLAVPMYVYPKLCGDASLPPRLGFAESLGKEDGEVRISEMAPEQKRRVARSWNTGRRKFLSFKTCGDTLVGLCRVPITVKGADPSARSLVCLRATDGDKCNVVWEHEHVYGDWEDTEDDYVRHPQIQNFNLTRYAHIPTAEIVFCTDCVKYTCGMPRNPLTQPLPRKAHAHRIPGTGSAQRRDLPHHDLQ